MPSTRFMAGPASTGRIFPSMTITSPFRRPMRAFYNGTLSGWSIANNVDMTTGKFIQSNNSEVAQTTVTQVVSSPSSGIELPGNTITLTLKLSSAVTVSGTPTLSLNDGGTATYTGGSGTNALTFSYTVSSSDRLRSALAITQFNLPNGATVKDGNGNAPNFAGAAVTFTGLQIDPPAGPTADLARRISLDRRSERREHRHAHAQL